MENEHMNKVRLLPAKKAGKKDGELGSQGYLPQDGIDQIIFLSKRRWLMGQVDRYGF